MARGIRVEMFILRDDGSNISPETQAKIVRKIIAFLKRLNCTAHGTWRLSEPEDSGDLSV